MLRTVEMAAADARARGIDVEVRAVDDREDLNVAAHVAGELAADPSVIAVVGHKNSGPSGAAGPVYAEAGLAQITQCSTDNALSRAGWPTFFRLCADNERQAAVAAEFVHKHHPAAHAVAVHDGTGYGRPLVEAFAARLRALSGRGVTVLAMHVGQEDFSEIVSAIQAANAGVVDSTPQASTRRSSARRADPTTPLRGWRDQPAKAASTHMPAPTRWRRPHRAASCSDACARWARRLLTSSSATTRSASSQRRWSRGHPAGKRCVTPSRRPTSRALAAASASTRMEIESTRP